MSSKTKLYRASLLDRFIDAEPLAKSEIRIYRGYDIQSYKDSLKRDLSNLLNTRSSAPTSVFGQDELTVLDYGIPDFMHLSPDDPEDRMVIARLITHAIVCFEPRIHNPVVEIEPELNKDKSVNIFISGMLILLKSVFPVSFITKAQMKTCNWIVNER